MMMANRHVWKRNNLDSDPSDKQMYIQEKSFNRVFTELLVNTELDVLTKRVALKAAPSVVCLKIFSGDTEIRWGSGFILECHAAQYNQFECIIITSASLLRIDHALLDNLKVVVVVSDGVQCNGDLEAHDFHYNIAAIKIKAGHAREVAKLRLVSDSMPITIPVYEEHPLHCDGDALRLIPGSPLLALGRYHDAEGSIMVAPGLFSIEQSEYCRFDCKELLRSTCRITQCGIGGPVINQKAEVIGITFFSLEFTPFLPSNIISKWWKHFQKYKYSMEKGIRDDPWNLQPHRKKSVPFDVKSAVLKASAPVVGILTHLGEEIFRGSGFVIECNAHRDGKFLNTILTSATILRPQPHIDEVMEDIEISVILANNTTCKGFVSACNFHYNIGTIELETDVEMETASLRYIDDAISFDPNLLDETPPKYNHQSGKYILVPGDTVVALGRNPDGQNTLMAVDGEFCLTEIQLDCQELFGTDLQISKHGIGGPLINCYGEVIGLNFFCRSFTPFLPINIVSMWWEQSKKNSNLVPRLGMQMCNLCLVGAGYLEMVTQRFPNTFKGVYIEEITSTSPSFANILEADIITKCDGKPVGSILELFELIWHKIGEPVDLTLLRPRAGSHQTLTMSVDHVRPNQINRWPLPREKNWRYLKMIESMKMKKMKL